jgi:hypothetical protein
MPQIRREIPAHAVIARADEADVDAIAGSDSAIGAQHRRADQQRGGGQGEGGALQEYPAIQCGFHGLTSIGQNSGGQL